MGSVTHLSNLRLLHAGDGLAVAEVGPVCVVIWRSDVTRPRFDRQLRGLNDVVERHPGEAAVLFVVEPTAGPPNEELRKASLAMLADHQDRLKCAAAVVEGTGFKAAVARSVLSGITLLLARRSAPMSYFATVAEAAPWIAQYVAIEPNQFVTTVEVVRRRLAPIERKLA